MELAFTCIEPVPPLQRLQDGRRDHAAISIPAGCFLPGRRRLANRSDFARTTGMKRAACWPVKKRRAGSAQADPSVLVSSFQTQYGAKQCLGVRVMWRLEYPIGRSD